MLFKKLKKALGVGLIACLPLIGAGQAQAQISLQLGGSDAEIKRFMLQNGYSEIKVTQRKLTSTRLEACKDGIRYFIKMRFIGVIEEQREIGKCDPVITQEQIAQQLKDKGYTRINVEEINGDFVVIACFNNDRLRTRIDKRGVVKENRNLGQCREALSPTDVTAMLEEAGYDRVEFTDRQLPGYVAQACKQGRRYELRLNRFGEVRNETQLGRCERAFSGNDLPTALGELGYDRVKVIDDRRAPYLVEACRENVRYELDVGRYGRVRNRIEIGKCNPPLTRADIAKSIRSQGLTRIAFTTIPGTDYLLEACQNNERLRIRFTQYGDIIKQEALGECEALSLAEIRAELDARGVSGLKIYYEGCERGRRVRTEINDYGDPVSRERVGRC